ncbi:hypothetical protein ACFUJY_29605 [Streptomyces sp. NPDC057249]|uniref:hypothetical protein n=1 Tax=Streptomyces sp. NPDC057249 TaxID=3346067 RepID=UPI0036389C62
MTATTAEAGQGTGTLADALRLPVWNALAERADGLRRALPDRPENAEERFQWLRALSPAQARRAELLDRLDALCGHLAGRPAPGYAPDDSLPDAALEAADGFCGEETAELIAAYRAGQRARR